MRTNTKLLIIVPMLLAGWAALSQTANAPKSDPQYTGDGQLRLPANYREWVFLSSGFDMSYATAGEMDHHMFDNVFVNPEAWRAFMATGTWPDKTVFILELRQAQSKGSINQKGSFQDSDVMGVEVHVKDQARFEGNWAFFQFPRASPTATMIPMTRDCYSCHKDHGAVDTTFVQFYPTLMPIATKKGTLSATYQKETAK